MKSRSPSRPLRLRGLQWPSQQRNGDLIRDGREEAAMGRDEIAGHKSLPMVGFHRCRDLGSPIGAFKS
ncbi:hypothetical protein L484_003828 [Morus notabilis]|uniref:Uncharacterized protein n=1 Tax=Morus notabilis TaxID=981085 RepID=W9QJS1_9ROSA|nr:hypothetical protein L484_003828 [Morus notabilis]